MMKNSVDVMFGGLTFWMFGYGLGFGDEPGSNPFCGWGDFFVHANSSELGWIYSKFFFQSSFATTATTIVSGSMAERTRLDAYIVFSMLNTFIFCIPAHWTWAPGGWLYELGVIDIAGAGPVHLVGGLTGLVATLMLKPRHGRFSSDKSKRPPMGSPTNAILGMFMLWWGWLGFNCGSTFGISGLKWKLAARSAVTTALSSVAGGIVGIMTSYIFKNRRFDVVYTINGILGSLVGITASCALAKPWEAMVIGVCASLITNGVCALLDKLKIDDPVGCVGTHAASGMFSLLASGLLTEKDELADALQLQRVRTGLVYSGQFYQLGIQAVAVVSICAWTIIMSYIFLKLIQVTVGLRVTLEEEIIGSDIVEHAVGGVHYDKETRMIVQDIANHEEPDIIRHHDQQTTFSRRRQSHTYGRRMSCQSESCNDSIYFHLPELPVVKEEESKSIMKTLLKNIASRCIKSKKHVLFNHEIHNTLSTSKEQGDISVVQPEFLLPSLPFCKENEELEREKTTTYV
ncbi:putative ammonium transporter 3 [Saccostrea cucullata]|uniref:putative ammonium transporter 3 n=1 Tax=Saccostrea cuccullata TaxID=36930 RepID=UPI002ED26A2C